MDMETGTELWTVHRKMSTEISLVLLKSREIFMKHSEINITENLHQGSGPLIKSDNPITVTQPSPRLLTYRR